MRGVVFESKQALANYYFQRYEVGKRPGWIFKKKIYIYPMSDISEDILYYVKQGILNLINSLGLDFEIITLRKDINKTKQVQKHNKNGILDVEGLVKEIVKENQATVVLTNLRLNTGHSGVSEFSKGYIVFGFKDSSPSFAWQLAKHEACHLFGFDTHHSNISVKGISTKGCVADPSASTIDLCPICNLALNSFWKGVENFTGKRFFK